MADDAPYDKAIQETAKAVQVVTPVLEKFAGRLSRFLHNVLGEALEHLGGAFSDWAQTYRYENAVKLADRVEAIHRQRGIAGKTVPISPRLAIPLLEGATLESDPTLAEMWAGLIANATDPESGVHARRSYSQLLSSLEPIDALVLKEIQRHDIANSDRAPEPNLPEQRYDEAGLSIFTEEDRKDQKARIEAWHARWSNPASIMSSIGADEHDVKLALENIERLGLAVSHPDPGFPFSLPLTHHLARIELSATGRALLAACASEGRGVE